ncbi:MAG TPA: S49 family peptidase, partial [Phnomibacter sp.]|nr:S49 family peptidase [Phnomibacter sp.]
MNTFFKVFFACLLAIVVAGFLMVMVLVGVAGIITSKEKPVVQENSVLYIDLSDKVMEQGREDDLDLNQLNIETVLGLHEVIGSIHHAISDPSIKGIYLHCTRNSLGLAGSQELGSALDSFKASGKPIVAYADVMSMRAYEIAHRATHVYAQPNGMVEWNGYFVEVMFLKNLLDKIAVKPEIFYAGEFKSATEPFRMTRMSDANRLQYQAYLNTIYSSLLLSVARHRGIDTVTL